MKLSKKDKQQISDWCIALESGLFEQGKERLQDGDMYCCLGVACITSIDHKYLDIDSYGFLMGAVAEDQIKAPNWLKKINDDFNEKTGTSLIRLNDTYGESFVEIAKQIRQTYLKEELC